MSSNDIILESLTQGYRSAKIGKPIHTFPPAQVDDPLPKDLGSLPNHLTVKAEWNPALLKDGAVQIEGHLWDLIITLAKHERLPDWWKNKQLSGFSDTVSQIEMAFKVPLSFETGGRKLAIELVQGSPYYGYALQVLKTINSLYEQNDYYPPSIRLTIKGMGAQGKEHIFKRRDSTQEIETNMAYLKDSVQIDGRLSHHGEEFAIPRTLQGTHLVKDIDGKEVEYEYVPGRYLMTVLPIEVITVWDEEARHERQIELSQINNQFPLATGENQLCIEVFLETGGMSWEELIIQLNSCGYDTRKEQEEIIITVRDQDKYSLLLKNVATRVMANPLFHSSAQQYLNGTIDNNSFLRQYLKTCVIRAWYDAQLLSKYVNQATKSRSGQNILLDFADVDWENCSVRNKSQGGDVYDEYIKERLLKIFFYKKIEKIRQFGVLGNQIIIDTVKNNSIASEITRYSDIEE